MLRANPKREVFTTCRRFYSKKDYQIYAEEKIERQLDSYRLIFIFFKIHILDLEAIHMLMRIRGLK